MFVIVLVAFIVGLAAALLFGPDRQPPVNNTDGLVATVLPDPQALVEFEMQDHRGQPFTQDDFQGHWSLVFFGFTSCPDICPMTLQVLADVRQLMQDSGSEPPSVALVSVDPARDDIPALQQYVAHFDPEFIGLRGADEQLLAFAKQLGAYYQPDAPDEDGNYNVAHSAALFLIDPRGRYHAVFSPPHYADQIATAMDRISG